MDKHASREAAALKPVHADHPDGALALVFALLALAGWVDALGLVQWHGVYVSFMSGNSTVLGTSAALADWRGTSEAAGALLLFVVGAVLGELIGPAARAWRGPAVLGAEAILLGLALAADLSGLSEAVTAAFTGLAMGIQTAAIHGVGGTAMALTYVTGTLVNMGRGIAAALRGATPWRRVVPFVGCWVALVAGAAAGGVVARWATADALAVAATLATALALLSAVGVARRNTRPADHRRL